MMKISIVGSGNVGTHLQKAFTSGRLKAELINSRKPGSIDRNSDVIIITVSDRAIEDVAAEIHNKMPHFDGVVVHTAGSVGMEVLQPYFSHYGVLYPLQTFSKDLPIEDYSVIPVFIEAESHESVDKIKKVAGVVFKDIYELKSGERKALHLASVFACNFTNAMYAVAEAVLKDAGLPFSTVIPLIDYTSAKTHMGSPKELQTGPARRGDKAVMESQIQLLDGQRELQQIYKTVSEYIYNKYNE